MPIPWAASSRSPPHRASSTASSAWCSARRWSPSRRTAPSAQGACIVSPGLGRLPVAPSLLPGRRIRAASPALSSDPRRLARNAALAEAAPWLFLGKPTVSWLAAVTGAMRRLEDSDNIARLGVPTLIVTAGQDAVVDSRAAERLAWRMRSGSSLTIPFARHELLQEADRFRAPFMEAFESFTAGALPLD